MATTKRGEVQAREQTDAGGAELARLRKLCLAIPGIVLDTKPDWSVVAQLLREAFAMVSAAKPRSMARARGTARR